ncbi:MAG TPA: serine hydrolase [Pyrinomonadaceae bacterium]|jgi:CubicO group peptidase (beta-lactamase class C family)|nr:serine hydrolase [Pyrinomonadaceae bacterium]
MKHSIALILLLTVFPFFVFSQQQTLEQKLTEIDAYANTVMDTWHGPGMAIAIVKEDKVVFAKGYGVRELGKPDKVDENTLFAIASNSKAFTTASLAILVDEGKINWNDRVTKYLPDFQVYDPWVTNELTIRDIVSHRSGLDTFSGDLLWYTTTHTTDDILRRVRYLKPVSSFRTRYGYQNLMFVAAGRIVEKVSGMKWADFVRTRILTPLGMDRTTTSVTALKDNYAMPHNESGGSLRVLQLQNFDNTPGAVGLNASVSDLTKWIRLQLGRGTFEGKKIYSSDRSWEMWSPNTLQPISENAWKANPTRHFSAYAMGWGTYDYMGRKIVNHSGGLDGMLSYTVLIPEENAGFVVLTNNESGSFQIMMAKIRDMLVDAPKTDWNAKAVEQVAANKAAQTDADKKSDEARIPNTQPSLALANYAGTYTSQMYGDVMVAEENGKLVMRMVPTPTYVADLEHWHLDTWRIHWRPSVGYNFPRGFVTFTIDKNGKTDQLKFDQPNNDLWFYELELHRTK